MYPALVRDRQRVVLVEDDRAEPRGVERVPVDPSQGRSIQSDVGVEFIGVRSGVERRRGRGLKARGGLRETPGKVLKE